MINGYWQAKIGLHSTVLVNGVIVTLLATIYFLFGNQTFLGDITSEARPWIAINGLCGFLILTVTAIAFPKIGAASVIVLMISGQITTGIIVDHLGIMNLPHHPVSALRILGVLFVALGVLLTTRN
jgi:transporter family-2 protein